jgi:hypothetical protein
MIYDRAAPFTVRDSTVDAARSLICANCGIEITIDFVKILNPLFCRSF